MRLGKALPTGGEIFASRTNAVARFDSRFARKPRSYRNLLLIDSPPQIDGTADA
jgi:hypothetical protein